MERIMASLTNAYIQSPEPVYTGKTDFLNMIKNLEMRLPWIIWMGPK